MAITEHATGSQAATLDTEHTLSSGIATAGMYQLVLDVNAMANGDVLLVRVKERARSGDTTRLEEIYTLANLQTKKLWRSDWFAFDHDGAFSIEQTDGTGRTYPWSIRAVT